MAIEQSLAVLRYMGGLVFDAVFEEQHNSDLQVTDNPVETGVVVSDHAFMLPLRCTIIAGVTDTPLRTPSDDAFVNGVSRSKEAFRLLQELQKAAEPFDVQTGLRLYQNMVCLSVRATGDKASENSVSFTAELREIQIVTTETVTYPPRKAGATRQQASKTKAKGEQQGTEKTPAKDKSIAKSLKDLVKGSP